jgi:hypothetical protein
MWNILACPGEVFEQVVSGPRQLANWRVPTLLVVLAGIISIQCGALGAHFDATLRQGGAVPDPVGQNDLVAGFWPIVSAAGISVAAFGGSIWSAFVLWFIGRVFLKARFSWLKTLEVVGLSGSVVVLGLVVNGLLVAICGDVNARPALSLLVGKLGPASQVRQVFGAADVFNLWSTAIMAVGLSKLSAVSFKEAAFWVFCYWFGVRIALIILA